jgi:mRNA-degrading endonuclease RelE of RelBE toxin-antitoxin system
MNFDSLDEFTKSFERLRRKYRSLSEDLEELKDILKVSPEGVGSKFSVLHRSEKAVIVKARFFCRYLRESSLRIVYAYHNNTVTFVFLEIFSKSDKAREDEQLIRSYLLSLE